jgi:hypothetical protein
MAKEEAKEDLFDDNKSKSAKTFLDAIDKDKEEKKEEPKAKQEIDWLGDEVAEVEEEPKTKTKKEQVGDLRKSRDEALVKMTEMQATIDEFKSKATNGDLDGVTTIIRDEFEGDPSRMVETFQSNKQKNDDLEKSLGSEKSKVRGLEITQSDEWRTEVVAPITRAEEDVYVAIAGSFIRKNGEKITVDHREVFDGFVSKLTGDKGPKSAIELKATMKEFATAFKRKTGEEYDMSGTTREVMSALGNIADVRTSGAALYKDWESKRSDLAVKQTAAQNDIQKERVGQILKSFKEGTTEAYRGFDNSDFSEAIPSDVVKNAFLDSYSTAVGAIEDPSKAQDWASTVTVTAKGRMFDSLVKAYKKATEELEDYRAAENDGLKGSRRSASSDSKDEVDWLKT